MQTATPTTSPPKGKRTSALYGLPIAAASDDCASMADTTDDLQNRVLGSQRARLMSALNAVPRRLYVRSPTPVEPMERLSKYLGGPDIYVKRDDLLPLAGGGSKTRKLEYLAQAALDEGADTLVTCGAVQSNHCRLTASAAAREGLACHLILEERVKGSYKPDAGGNNYAFALLGATTEVVPAGAIPEAEARAMADLRAKGKKPYWIPGGGSNELGALGYARCAAEILAHAEEAGPFDAIVTCSGSGGTHSGLLAGLRAAGDHTPVHGISVRFDAETQAGRIYGQYAAVAQRLGLEDAAKADVVVHDRFVGPGYSLPTAAMHEAITLFARLESVFLDPVYTGKGAAGLLGLVRDGTLKKGQKVLFLHTGGAPSLFHYQPPPVTGPVPAAPAVRPRASPSRVLSDEELAAVYGSD